MLAPLFVVPALAATLDVGLDPNYPTIQSAVWAADSGDTLVVHAGYGPDEGDYREWVGIFDRDLEIVGSNDPRLVALDADGFFLIGEDSSVRIAGVTLDGDSQFRAMMLLGRADVQLEDCTIQDTYDAYAGGSIAAWENSTLTITRSSFSGSGTGSYGAGGFITAGDGATLSIHESRFSEGHAAYGGAIHLDTWRDGSTISDSVFVDNVAREEAGAVYTDSGALTISGSRFCNNTGPYGGAVHVHAPVQITGSVFLGNEAALAGGALQLWGAPAVISHNDFIGNTAAYGGALQLEYSWIELHHNIFASNTELALDTYDLSTVSSGYNLWWDNEPPPNVPTDIYGDPRFTDLDLSDCEDSVLTLQPDSAALDAGDPAQPDEDGSPADIGAFGPEPADPTTPGDTGTPAPLDGSTASIDAGDGLPIPPDPDFGCGCGVAPGWPVGLAWLPALWLRRRSRR